MGKQVVIFCASSNLIDPKYNEAARKLVRGLHAKGYDIVSGGGDIGETTAVNNGTVDFGVTWVSNLISANAGGMDLLEIAQVYQRSGLVLVYKK